MLKLELQKVKALLANVNVRAENSGEDKKPAADLKIMCDLSNDFLAFFHPNLKGLLYFYDASVQGADLADQARAHEPGFAPHLRMPSLGELEWEAELIGAKVTVHYGIGGKSDIDLELCKVNSFRIMPKQGGTITLTMRVQCHPDEKQFGKLANMIQGNIEISMDPMIDAPLAGTE